MVVFDDGIVNVIGDIGSIFQFYMYIFFLSIVGRMTWVGQFLILKNFNNVTEMELVKEVFILQQLIREGDGVFAFIGFGFRK